MSIGRFDLGAGFSRLGAARRGGFTPVLDTAFWKRFQYAGINPSVVLDFENGVYWDGTTAGTSPTAMVGGSPTITPGSGLLANSASITGTGALLSALQGGAFSLQLATSGGTQSQSAGIFTTNTTDGPFVQDAATNNVEAFLAAGSIVLSPIGETIDWTTLNHFMMNSSVSGAARNIAELDPGGSIKTGNDAHPFAANPSTITLGAYGGLNNFGGFIRHIAAVSNVWSTNAVLPPAFQGTNGLWWAGDATRRVDYGNILQFDRTQPWTMVAAVCLFAAPASAALIFTNSDLTPTFTGYEAWIDPQGKLRSRLISNFGTNNYIGGIGSTNLIDRKWHVVAVSNDGSGTVAGMKMYVDGVAETVTDEGTTLSGSIVSAANDWQLFNQTGTNLGLTGALGLFRLFNRVLNPAAIAKYKINKTLPPVDSTCVLAPKLNEGGSNTTTGDLSAGNHTGTLSTASLWLRG